jgi:lipopolysaccharide export system protein LptA
MPAVLKLLFFPLFVMLSLPAFAEKADREKPVHLEADSVTLDDINKISVFQGNVLLIQGTLMLRADRVDARQNADGLQNISAKGNPVSFRQKRDGVDEYIEGFARQVEYDSVQSILRLIGDARLRKGGDEIRGSQITYDAKTEFYKVVGQEGAAGASGRVRVIIRPKPKTGQEAGSQPQQEKNKAQLPKP